MMPRVLVAAALLITSGFALAADVAPPLRASYHSELEKPDAEGTLQKRVMDWLFERGLDYVEISAPADRRAEKWVRDPEGRVWYSRLFHAERKVIEYQPTDLTLGGITNSWNQIRSVFDPHQLAALEGTNVTKEIAGHRARVYRGNAQGVDFEVWWLEDLNLPALVSKRSRRNSSTLRLIEVTSISPTAAKAVPADYELMDFSDLGDRHHDPFVEKLMKYDGLWFGH